MGTRLAWSCRTFHHWRIAWNIAHRLLTTGITPIEGKIVPRHQKSVTIISTNTKIRSMNANNTVFNVNKNHPVWRFKRRIYCMFRCVSKKTIPLNKPEAVLARCQDARLMTGETRGHICKRWCSMTVCSLIDTLSWKPATVYTANITPKPDGFPKVSNSFLWIKKPKVHHTCKRL